MNMSTTVSLPTVSPSTFDKSDQAATLMFLVALFFQKGDTDSAGAIIESLQEDI